MVCPQNGQMREHLRAGFWHVAATNSCPCGYSGDLVKECSCSHVMIQPYRKRISGPLLDQIDSHIEVPRVDYEKLSGDRLGEPSADIRARIEKARDRAAVVCRGCGWRRRQCVPAVQRGNTCTCRLRLWRQDKGSAAEVRYGWSPSCRLSSDSLAAPLPHRAAAGRDQDVACAGGLQGFSTHEGRQVRVVCGQSDGYGKRATQPCRCATLAIRSKSAPALR